jgi:cephalosporin hydroxylase
MNRQDAQAVEAFHNLYYAGLTGEGPLYGRTTWMGVPCWKCPLDLWIYQEIIAEVKPDLIVETGTAYGGSALFLAHLLDILGKGRVITIDVAVAAGPCHPRISYITGSSGDANLIESLLAHRPAETCLVILDSDHAKHHVLQEMKLLAPYVSVGSYLIVEDTNVNGHPAWPGFGPGPYEAVEEFLRNNDHFAVALGAGGDYLDRREDLPGDRRRRGPELLPHHRGEKARR